MSGLHLPHHKLVIQQTVIGKSFSHLFHTAIHKFGIFIPERQYARWFDANERSILRNDILKHIHILCGNLRCIPKIAL